MKYQREIGKSGVEAEFREQAEKHGRRALKFVSPGLAGVPDRMVLHGHGRLAKYLSEQYGWSDHEAERKARLFIALVIEFCEIKSPGKPLEPHQKRRHAELTARGLTCSVVDTKEKAGQWFEDRA